MNHLSTTIAALTCAAVSTLTVSAQDFEAHVVPNPDDSVTYSIDLNGPPAGLGAILVAPLLMPVPFHLPGMGNLFLDAGTMFSLGGVQLGPTGSGTYELTVPWYATDGATLYFQTIVVDSALHLALAPDFAGTRQSSVLSANKRISIVWKPDGQASFIVSDTPGTTYTIEIRNADGDLVQSRDVTVGASGNSPQRTFSGVQRDWTYSVYKDIGNGHVSVCWAGSFS